MSEYYSFRELVVTTVTKPFRVQKVIYSFVTFLQTGDIIPLVRETPVRVNCDEFSEDGVH